MYYSILTKARKHSNLTQISTPLFTMNNEALIPLKADQIPIAVNTGNALGK